MLLVLGQLCNCSQTMYYSKVSKNFHLMKSQSISSTTHWITLVLITCLVTQIMRTVIWFCPMVVLWLCCQNRNKKNWNGLSKKTNLNFTRRYGRNRGPTSSFCGGLWPRGCFAFQAKNKHFEAVVGFSERYFVC